LHSTQHIQHQHRSKRKKKKGEAKDISKTQTPYFKNIFFLKWRDEILVLINPRVHLAPPLRNSLGKPESNLLPGTLN
jgi:hypothetical protein